MEQRYFSIAFLIIKTLRILHIKRLAYGKEKNGKGGINKNTIRIKMGYQLLLMLSSKDLKNIKV